MARVAIVVPQHDFRDETYSQLSLFLGKRGIERVVASQTARTCSGYHGAVVKPNISIMELDPVHIEALILVDGPGFDSLRMHENRQFLDIVRQFHENKRLIAGVGNSVKAIARANIVKEVKVARLGEEEGRFVRLYHGILTEEPVVIDNNILTLSNFGEAEEATRLLAKALGVG